MKKLLILSALFFCNMAFSQSDTIYLKNNQKLAVKISEITESEIRYRRADMDDSPLFVSYIDNVSKIKYRNGTSQVFVPDELAVPYDVKEIVKQKEAFKFYVFDLPAGKIAFGYERVLRPGINSDFKAGIFNSSIYSSFNSNFDGNLYNPYGAGWAGGTFVKGGLKILAANNSRSKGKSYGHLLSGGYIRFDAYISYINYRGINYFVPDPTYVAPPNNNYYYNNPTQGMIQKTTDAKNYNYGFLICVGAQHVMANVLTIDYYAGLGFNGSSYSFSQSDFGTNGPIVGNNQNYYYYNRYFNPRGANVLAAQRFSNFMAGTIGFNLGFVYKRKMPMPQTHK
jgi:hypothetical protein